MKKMLKISFTFSNAWAPQLVLHDGKCPLCAKGQSHEEFSYGIENAENLAKKLSENAEAVSQYEQEKNLLKRD
ncbi:hypothetical protein [Thiohalophilus sp.]|uniref:hypothetical protein n=1 Tax=Thiohalophilus sp. TaxID=3028392 RepID=UPI002ACE8914|nr:hypothetical protein [Thiohalophilus sp.]MDZ7802973.1 hypothetical protein [Thiohalophilus sp.]